MPVTRPDVYRNLSMLLAAGIPLDRALQSASRSTVFPLRRAFAGIREGVARGQGLAEAMADQGRTFGRLDVAVVAVGEVSGGLEEAFRELADYYAMRAKVRSRLRVGLLLPAIVWHAGAVLAGFPRWILGVTTGSEYFHTVLAFWALFWAPVAAVWLVLRVTPPDGFPRRALDGLALGIPVLGRAVSRAAVARFFSAFHLLYGGGVPIAKAVRQSADACGNAVYARRFSGAADSADAGQPAWQGLSRNLPAGVRDAWEVGEESGELAQVSGRLARSMAAEADHWLDQFITWLPRVIYLGVMIFLVWQILTLAPMVYAGAWELVE